MDAAIGPATAGSIEIRELSRRFGDRRVLDGASLAVGPGTLVGIVGENGSGKTTLLRILAGVVVPDRGDVRIGGEPPGGGRTGFVPPGDRGLYWRLTGRQNLEFFARLVRSRAADLDWAVDALGARELLTRQMGRCSTGQRRRVAIARGFAGRPPVILLDEPYADLDEAGCRGVDAACRMWTRGGGVVVFAAPMPSEGPDPDRLFTLSAGTLAEAAA